MLNAVHSQANEVSLDRTLLRRLEVESWGATARGIQTTAAESRKHRRMAQRDRRLDRRGDRRHRPAARRGSRAAAAGRRPGGEVRARKPASRRTRRPLPPFRSNIRTLLPGKERPRQKRLDWWDRFQTADGVVATIARSAVALGIVGSVIAIGAHVGSSSMTIYNALAVPVRRRIRRTSRSRRSPIVRPPITVPAGGQTRACGRLRESSELIEEFDRRASRRERQVRLQRRRARRRCTNGPAIYTPEGSPNTERPPPKRPARHAALVHHLRGPRVQKSRRSASRRADSSGATASPGAFRRQ